MGPFDFLNNIKQGLEQYFQPAMNQASNTLGQFFPSRTLNFRLDKSPKAPDIHPIINAASKPQQPTPAPTGVQPQDINAGFANFGPNVPVATASSEFAQAGNQLPPNIDSLLPAIIALMETGGGAKQVGANNPFNIRGIQDGNTQFIDYPDLKTALLGGDNGGVNSQGFVGQITNNPNFSTFRDTGNIADFFNTYTPPGAANGNPSLEDLVARYKAIEALFPSGR